MITVFTLTNQFICLFLKKLNNFVGFLTPVLKKRLIHIRSLMAAPPLLFLPMFHD